MFLLQRCHHYRGVLITEVSSLQRCPHYRGVLITEVSSIQGCPQYRGVLITGVTHLRITLYNRLVTCRWVPRYKLRSMRKIDIICLTVGVCTLSVYCMTSNCPYFLLMCAYIVCMYVYVLLVFQFWELLCWFDYLCVPVSVFCIIENDLTDTAL